MDIVTLLAECSHIQEDWPPIDDMTIYVHIMTNLDATHTDVEDAATYVGQSGNVRRRIWYHEKEIERAREADPGNAPPKQNPTHYDIAPLTPSGHSHWIAAVSADIHRKLQHVDLGPHLALFMLEQTIIVLLGSYAPWLAGRQAYGSPTGWFVGAKTMTGAAERVRTSTGLPFPCVWPLVRGTNVSSPILRPHTGARYEGCASEIHSIYIPGPAHRPTSLLLYPPNGSRNDMYSITKESKFSANIGQSRLPSSKKADDAQPASLACDTCMLTKNTKAFSDTVEIKCTAGPDKNTAIHVVYLSGPAHFHHWPNCPKDGQELRSFPHLSLLTQSQDLAPVQCDF